jgi:transposase-like protein
MGFQGEEPEGVLPMSRKSKKRAGGGSRRRGGAFPFELKLRAVKLYLEEGHPRGVIAGELGVGKSTLTAWAKQYREEGEAGLGPRAPRKGRAQVSEAAKAKALELKRRKGVCYARFMRWKGRGEPPRGSTARGCSAARRTFLRGWPSWASTGVASIWRSFPPTLTRGIPTR